MGAVVSASLPCVMVMADVMMRIHSIQLRT